MIMTAPWSPWTGGGATPCTRSANTVCILYKVRKHTMYLTKNQQANHASHTRVYKHTMPRTKGQQTHHASHIRSAKTQCIIHLKKSQRTHHASQPSVCKHSMQHTPGQQTKHAIHTKSASTACNTHRVGKQCINLTQRQQTKHALRLSNTMCISHKVSKHTMHLILGSTNKPCITDIGSKHNKDIMNLTQGQQIHHAFPTRTANTTSISHKVSY